MQNNKNKSAVLLITFNRPDHTIKVLEKVSKANIGKLYIYNDGPRPNNEEDIKARERIKKDIHSFNWNCELSTLFNEENLGCGPGPVKAINWIFEKEDYAIILEDDCVPSLSFFDFCSTLLDKYKNDTRVWTISGNNFKENIPLPYSYIFSYFGQSWGWATWKRCWLEFKHDFSKYLDFIESGGFNNVFYNSKMAKYFNKKYENRYRKKDLSSHAWDFFADFMVKQNGGLSIVPKRNLVTNIGIIGTHSSSESVNHNRPFDESFVIKEEPPFVLPYYEYDSVFFEDYYYSKNKIFNKIFRKIHQLFRKR